MRIMGRFRGINRGEVKLLEPNFIYMNNVEINACKRNKVKTDCFYAGIVSK